MNIQGLQKLTLLDYPEKVACTIFTAGCNFRCPFCHNASLVTHVDPDNHIPEEEVLAFLQNGRESSTVYALQAGSHCCSRISQHLWKK